MDSDTASASPSLHEVKVNVAQNKTTTVKYTYLKNILKYRNEVKILHYCPSLATGRGNTLHRQPI